MKNMQQYIKHPPRYVLASILCSFGGFLFGMDTGIIGPVTTMKDFTLKFGSESATIHGLIVSSILIPAAISSFFAGRVADSLGRTKDIAIGALIFGLGTALEAGAVSIAMFILGRIVEGIGEGLYLGTLVVYICEISPPNKRGPLTAAPQLMVTAGLVCGYFVSYGTSRLQSSLSWRTPFIILASLSAIFAVASYNWLIASPRWLLLRGRLSDVSSTWDRLEVGQAEREKAEIEMGSISSEVQSEHNNLDQVGENKSTTSSNESSVRSRNSLLDAFKGDARSRTLLAMFLLGMQQMSGIDGVLYYAPILFSQAGVSSTEASFLASGVSAIVIFSLTIPALIFSDKWGRRSSTIYGGLALSILMFLIGSLYAGNAVHSQTGAGRWVVIVSIYLFAAVFSISWAVGIKIYVAESQPQKTRASATNLAHGSNWVTNFLVALTTPILLAKSSFGAYFLFGGCALLTSIVCFLFVPETKGKPLDEIEEAFRSKSVVSKNIKTSLRRLFRQGVAHVDG